MVTRDALRRNQERQKNTTSFSAESFLPSPAGFHAGLAICANRRHPSSRTPVQAHGYNSAPFSPGCTASRRRFDRRNKVWDSHTRPRGKANAIYTTHARSHHPAAASYFAGRGNQRFGRCYCRPTTSTIRPLLLQAIIIHFGRCYCRPSGPTKSSCINPLGRCYCRPLTTTTTAAATAGRLRHHAATLQAAHDVRQLSAAATAGPYDDGPYDDGPATTVSHNVRPLNNVWPLYNVRPLLHRPATLTSSGHSHIVRPLLHRPAALSTMSYLSTTSGLFTTSGTTTFRLHRRRLGYFDDGPATLYWRFGHQQLPNGVCQFFSYFFLSFDPYTDHADHGSGGSPVAVHRGPLLSRTEPWSD